MGFEVQPAEEEAVFSSTTFGSQSEPAVVWFPECSRRSWMSLMDYSVLNFSSTSLSSSKHHSYVSTFYVLYFLPCWGRAGAVAIFGCLFC